MPQCRQKPVNLAIIGLIQSVTLNKWLWLFLMSLRELLPEKVGQLSKVRVLVALVLQCYSRLPAGNGGVLELPNLINI